MRRDPLALWWTHHVDVEPLRGHGGRGEVYGPPYRLPCRVEAGTTLVQTPEGTQQVLAVTIFAGPDSDLPPLYSRVTIPERLRPEGIPSPALVLFAARHDGPPGVPAHIEIKAGKDA